MSRSGLSWFYSLPLVDQVALLRDPKQPLPPCLVDRLSGQSGVIAKKWWVSSNDHAPLKLAAASRLCAIRKQLDSWWDWLADHERGHLTRQRDGELDEIYAEWVQAATGNAIEVEIEWDSRKENRFRLPPMIRTYVEMRVWSPR
jgi:hypothetical protein